MTARTISADEYRRRDEEALEAEIRERERFPQCSCGRPILGGQACTHGVAEDSIIRSRMDSDDEGTWL